MGLQLIPAPQQWFASEGTYCGGFFEALVSFPLRDVRLEKKLSQVFSSYACSSELTDVFCLRSGEQVDAPNAPCGTDSYALRICSDGICLTAATAAGFFYGLVTLTQLRQNYWDSLPCGLICDWSDTIQRFDYLDLRNLFPKKELLPEYIEEMASYKINGLIIEFEDRRPFDKFPFLYDEQNGLSHDDINRLRNVAYENFVEIIPKQQCFGHLEYILKHPVFFPLRETPDALGELCPLREGSLDMIYGLIDDLAALFPDSSYFHIGCDEVWSLGECPDCSASGKSRPQLFIDFVNNLAGHVCALGKKPLIWHDMLTEASFEDLSRLDKRVTVCVWEYGSARLVNRMGTLISKLQDSGISIFAACSVRCWDSNGDQNYPVVANRLRNVSSWVTLMKKFAIPSMISTNWGTPFTFGGPYGLFETSRYTAFFAAESFWNYQADSKSFLPRFLCQYHGIIPSDEFCDCQNEDYYEIASELIPHASRHKTVLKLISVLWDYEFFTKRKFPVHTFLYRSCGEITPELRSCISQKCALMENGLKDIRPRLKETLSEFLPDNMVETYICAKYFLPDVYSNVAERVLNAKEDRV